MLIAVGTLVGVYATVNGGYSTTNSYISRWRYTGNGQNTGNELVVPTSPCGLRRTNSVEHPLVQQDI